MLSPSGRGTLASDGALTEIIYGARGAIVATRFTTSVIVGGAAELLAVGTAVVIEPE